MFVYDNTLDLTNVVATVPLQINSCGINSNCKQGHVLAEDFLVRRPAGRHDYQLLYMASGNADFILNGKWQTVGSGKIVLYRPHVPQFYRINANSSMLCYWVHFSGKEADHLLNECGMGDKEFFSPGVCPAAEALLKAMIDEKTKKKPLYQDMIESLFRQAVVLLGRQLIQRESSCIYSSREKICSVIDYMSHHYSEFLHIDELANYCGLSKYHFIHLFQKCTGITPHSYLIHIRMEHAEKLLQNSNLSIQEVASACGYEEPLYFSRSFSKHFGISPTEYRQRFSPK